MPEAFNEEVLIVPHAGQLKAQEKKTLEINFIPLKKKKYKLDVPIHLHSGSHSAVVGFHHPGSAHLNSLAETQSTETSF